MSIPKIFHQIWLGGEKAMPDKHKILRDIMMTLHPDWDYVLWSEENFPPLINADYYNLCVKDCYKSDIARYEILAMHGGVYIDTDFLFYKPIDPLLNGTDNFFIEESEDWITNSLMGVRPNHQIMWRCVCELPVRFRIYIHKIGYERIGPGLICQVVREFKETANILPRPLFYPIFCNMVGESINQVYPAAFASHLWNNLNDPEWLDEATLKKHLAESKSKMKSGFFDTNSIALSHIQSQRGGNDGSRSCES